MSTTNGNLPSNPSGHIAMDGSSNSNNNKMKTPRPSDWQHAKILMARSFVKDKKKPALWAAKFLAIPVLFMLFTIGFFVDPSAFTEVGVINVGDFKLFPGQEWAYPSTMWISGWDATHTAALADVVQGLLLPESSNVNVTAFTDVTNSTEFISTCQASMPSTALEGVCVYFNASNVYIILYGGTEYSTPFQAGLAGAQYILNQALVEMGLQDIDGANITTLSYPVDLTQRTPRLLTASAVDVSVFLFLIPSILFVLSCCIALQFLIGPIVFEKINKVSEAYQMVGVKLRIYLFQWNLYYGLNFLLTAGVLTVISLYWKVFPLSSAFLIFMSHYLALLQLSCFFILLMQTQTQEESAQNKPWIVGLFSMAIGSALLILTEPTNIIFYILSIFFPFVGILQYFGIYITYDAVGYDTGIHLGGNVFESGLFGVYMAQVAGLLFFFGLTWLYSSQEFNNWLFNHKVDEMNNATMRGETSQDRFEPLVPGSEVMLSVRGLEYTYIPPPFSCDRESKPTEVLKGLDLDLCRGEVFGYLGHNGAGKTTSINILTGQLKMQQGAVKYHLREGDMNLRHVKDEHLIRTNIGVCPQHNTALQNDMTAREYLTLFAMLKGGIDMKPGQNAADSAAAEVDNRLAEIAFTSKEDSDKLIDTYSGGMKRKVLIAMALLGDPECIFLDEPTAGLDPYNRRTIWDMIISAKIGRSIILCSHFLDEVDVLSDRIGIIKNGVMTTCGSSLFLKHHFGVGYTMSFEAPTYIDVTKKIPKAEIQSAEAGSYRWRLEHGTETHFPETLEMLVCNGAKNVNLVLTTLEQVFLETGKENSDESAENDNERISDYDPRENIDVENPVGHRDKISKVWEPLTTKNKVGFWKKLNLVQHFMLLNALKDKENILLNVTMPLIYLIIGLILLTTVGVQEGGVLIMSEPILVEPFLATSQSMGFFGIPDSSSNETGTIFPILPVSSPTSIYEYFQGTPILGGYYPENRTLQYAAEISPFALQVGVAIVSNYTSWELPATNLGGIETAIQQLPYLSTVPFRNDVLFIPYCLVFGFAGLAFSLLDVLVLRGDKIIEIFRVNGVTEWTTYLGVMCYKFNTSFLPFFLLLVVLGFSLRTMIFGDAGRWLGTIFVCLAYAFSSSPQGLILAKRFIRSDFKSVANWFPGVYFTFVGLPYILYSVLLQTLSDAERGILIFGDILSIVPQVAFQRAIGAILQISTKAKDPELLWSDVWAFQTRIWYCILMMIAVGTLEWWYLFHITSTREAKTKLDEENRSLSEPLSVAHDRLIANERNRSLVDDEGINARDIVKVFEIREGKRRKKKLKRAVKGVSFGVRKNEIFALLGPNGAGKTVTMSILSSQFTPEHGQIVLDGVVAEDSDRNTDCLYNRGNVSYCAQADALFESLTVNEHCKFYAILRGLDWGSDVTQDHVGTIVELLGLERHQHKTVKELSGGYKRRLCLGISMIGYPNVCMLDECTTGVDPGARRMIWEVLKPEGVQVPPILMSSHDMEECAFLGSRIAIMIDGEIISTGSLNELYERYCTSFFVEISFTPNCDDTKTEVAILAEFQDISMTASVYESLPYHIKLQVTIDDRKDEAATRQLAQIFALLERNKRELDIKFYSVAKMNLEQIFISLSRKQFEADEQFESAPQESAQFLTSTRSL